MRRVRVALVSVVQTDAVGMGGGANREAGGLGERRALRGQRRR